MGNSEETKQRIISETIQLIKETDGAIDKITIREIANHSNIGVELINHYFNSKDELIAICVQSYCNLIFLPFQKERDGCIMKNPF